MRDKRWLLLVIALLVFLVALGRRDIVISHEARVAQTARQMSASGVPWSARKLTVPVVAMKDIGNGVMRLAPSGEGTFQINPWIVPVLNTQIRLQKPPLPYWCDAVCYGIFGTNEFAARFTPALLGAISTLLVYDLARQFSTRRVAFFSGLAWLSTHFVVEEFRKSMADPYLSFAALLATAAWVRAMRKESKSLLIFYVALGIGMLAKGPLIVVWLVIVLISLRRRVSGSLLMHLAGLSLFLLLGCSWYLYIYLTVPHAIDLWKYESLGELTSNTENVREWWFYFVNAPLILLPWGAIILVGALRQFHKRRFFLLLWPLLAFVLFSFVNQKKNAYLLPATPALAILAGVGLQTLVAVDRAKRGTKWPGILAGVQASVGIGFAIVVLVLSRNLMRADKVALGIIAASGIVAAYPLFKLLRGDLRRWPIYQAIAYAVVLAAFVTIYESSKENQRSARDFAHSAQQIIDNAGGRTIPAAAPEEVSFYLPLNYTGPRQNRQVFSIIDDPRGAITVEDSRLVFASKSGRWKLLKQQVR